MLNKTKTEMLDMTDDELKAHKNDAWDYYHKCKYVLEFKNLED